MKFAITPCPNDTFSYEALISKKIKSGFEFEFADIEELNIAAENGKYPLTKMSFPAYIKTPINTSCSTPAPPSAWGPARYSS